MLGQQGVVMNPESSLVKEIMLEHLLDTIPIKHMEKSS